eukprot:UN04205
MQIDDNAELLALIQTWSFANVVSEDLQASHLPLVLDRSTGGNDALLGHFARANPHWKQLDGGRVLVIFNGPHAYISPSWYAAGPAVPTWNYAAVHVHGQLTLCDAAGTAEVTVKMMAYYEPSLLKP